MELIKNVISGWTQYIQDGKYMVLFLGSILYLWYTIKSIDNIKTKQLLCYTTITTILILFPLSAAVLMKYQTAFYDYGWLWSMVPINGIIAYGAVEVYNECYFKRWNQNKIKTSAGIAFGLALLVLCGNMGSNTLNTQYSKDTKAEVNAIMDYLTQTGNNTNICIWAPQSIMEYARYHNGEIQLLYGRDMWNHSLGAYSYDVYPQDKNTLYEWMEIINNKELNLKNKQPTENIAEYCEIALGYGVNTILLHNTVAEEIQKVFTAKLGEGEPYKDYYIYRMGR